MARRADPHHGALPAGRQRFGSHTTMAALNPNLGFDPKRDFAPVRLVATAPMLLTTLNSRPWRSLGEVAASDRFINGKFLEGNRRAAAEEAGMDQDESSAAADQGRRGSQRDRVLKSGQIVFGSTVLNCVVLDISVSGARLSLTSPASVPEILALRLRDGSTYPACRRWAWGTEIGLEFTGRAISSGDGGHTRRAWTALEAVRAADPIGWLEILRSERFFGDEALRRAAEAAEAAHMRLEAALRPHAGGEAQTHPKKVG